MMTGVNPQRPPGRSSGSRRSGALSRRLARLTANPSGAVYGTIISTAVIAAASVHNGTPEQILAANVLTLLVFWLAHVYSEVLEHRLRTSEFHFRVVRATMANELAMVE